jgi:hypothetical protein
MLIRIPFFCMTWIANVSWLTTQIFLDARYS